MIITPQNETTLMQLLAGEFSDASVSRLKKMLKFGLVRVNGRIVTRGDIRIKPGDTVEYEKARPRDPSSPFTLVYEDEHILVSEKPAGVLCIGYEDQGDTSFYKEWLDHLRERSKGRERIFIVHRLDKEVSGLLVFAKNPEVQAKLKEEWHLGTKGYYALVEGRPVPPAGTIRNYIAEGPGERMVATTEEGIGKFAITHYSTLREYPGHTLLEVNLETGRKNQIRVHLAGLGCPITGDRRYGSKDRYTRRIRLHAFHLEFDHPVTGEHMKFETRIPKGFTVLRPEHEKYK
jgi:23S rRNA pseudouridine1911/1915/1917 synthase